MSYAKTDDDTLVARYRALRGRGANDWFAETARACELSALRAEIIRRKLGYRIGA